jgi:hypothetical protein
VTSASFCRYLMAPCTMRRLSLCLSLYCDAVAYARCFDGPMYGYCSAVAILIPSTSMPVDDILLVAVTKRGLFPHVFSYRTF